MSNHLHKIGLVGPCTSGKTTICQKLTEMGYSVRHIAQEHSFVQNMWEKISNPDILIFLDVSYEVSLVRRKTNWTLDEYTNQKKRLRHAQKHADFYIDTTYLSRSDVLKNIISFLKAIEN